MTQCVNAGNIRAPLRNFVYRSYLYRHLSVLMETTNRIGKIDNARIYYYIIEYINFILPKKYFLYEFYSLRFWKHSFSYLPLRNDLLFYSVQTMLYYSVTRYWQNSQICNLQRYAYIYFCTWKYAYIIKKISKFS